MYFVDSMDRKNLLELKMKVSRSGPPDPVLQSNLTFAIDALETRSDLMKMHSDLEVMGKHKGMRIRSGQVRCHTVFFSVFEDHNGRKLDQRVHFLNALNPHSIDEDYFIGHRCPHKIPCSQQARDAVCINSNVEIKIICKELRLTLIPRLCEKTITLPKTAR